MNEEIIQYDKYKHLDLFLDFRTQVENENGTALDRKKVDPENFNGAIFFHMIDSQVASIAAIERSTIYTEESNVARLCRFYILKKFRHRNSGFKLLPHLIQWGKDNDIQLLYWTHDKRNRALNSLYQHKRIRSSKERSYFLSDEFLKFKWDPSLTFITGKSRMEQYVYVYKLNENFNWNPKGLMVKS